MSSIDVIAAFALGMHPVLVSVAIVIAAITWATPAHAGGAAHALPVASSGSPSMAR